ncbi:MAG: hypothetical protein WCC30_12950 [Candidatus Dormiibacterota bacterium]
MFAAALAAIPAAADWAPAPDVFVQTNGFGGNAVIVYARHDDGSLSLAGQYSTGGLGGRETGSVVDPLASQGGLTYDPEHQLLIALNAGSNTASVFEVVGRRLELVQIVETHGMFPTSVAVHGSLAYVLNAGGAGSIEGFWIANGKLHPIEGSTRSLGLGNSNPPFYLSSPGQVGFAPDGRSLIVTTKSNNTIDIFAVSEDGRPSADPAISPSAGAVPFAFAFDRAERLIVTEAGTSSLSSYVINSDRSLSVVDASVANHQAATCWIATARGYYYVANAGSGDLSGYRINSSGQLSLIGGTDVAATTDGGPIDLVASPGGRYLYVESGGTGNVDIFRVTFNGTLMPLGSVAATPGLEGIAAS